MSLPFVYNQSILAAFMFYVIDSRKGQSRYSNKIVYENEALYFRLQPGNFFITDWEVLNFAIKYETITVGKIQYVESGCGFELDIFAEETYLKVTVIDTLGELTSKTKYKSFEDLQQRLQAGEYPLVGKAYK